MSTQTHTPETDSTIRSAAALMARCNGLWRDEHDRNSGWTIDYAVDVDVITLFMAPADNSDYATVFPSDNLDGTQDLLARMLGEFILLRLHGTNAKNGNTGNLLIISPHDEELERMTLALAAKVVKQTENAKKILEKILEHIIETPTKDRHELLAKVVEEARDLIEAFDGQSGPRRELNRLGSLPTKRLRNLLRFEPYSSPANVSEDAPILPPRGDVPTARRDEFVALVANWRALLKKHKVGRKPEYAMFGDALALATLQWVNMNLAKQKRRLILVTGSKYLFDAAEEVVTAKGSNFSRDFLRHPLSFVASKNFFANNSGQKKNTDLPFRLFDWLNLFFPAAVKSNPQFGISVDSRLLKSIAEGTNKELNKTLSVLARNESRSQGIDHFPKDMLDQWSSVVRTTATLNGFSNSEVNWSKRVGQFVDLVNARLDQGWTVEKFQNELDQLTNESVSNLYWSTSRFGVLSDSKVSVRGLPSLRFDSPYEEAQNISKKLISGVFKNSVELDVEQLYGDLREMDSSNYHAHVIHALAYAGKGHWSATRTLCLIALNVVDTLKENDRNFRDGREAAYLLAICERRLAKDETDILNKARPVLDMARARENVLLKGLPEDIRFRSEEFAQKSLTYQFRFFSNADRPSIDIHESLIGAEAIISDALTRYELDKLGEVKNWVIRQTSTNGLILAILAEQVNPGSVTSTSSLGLARRLIKELISNGLCPDTDENVTRGKLFRDSLSDFVFRVAVSMFDSSARKRKIAREEVSNTISIGSSQLPFEDTRLKLFKSLAPRFG